MINGAKLVTKEGLQVACFPSQQIYITQGANSSYSHFGTKNTDNACVQNKRLIYAPVDMVCYSRQGNGTYGITIYHSVEKVLLASGRIDYFTLVCMHDNNSSRWEVGKTYKQGELIYQEGDADPSGLTTGIHVHYEVAYGKQTDRIISVSGGRYHITNPVYIDEIFFTNFTEVLRENATGSWVGDRLFKFKQYTGESIEGSKNILHAMIVKALPNVL